MDITFKTENGRFNYRVCAIILHGGKILAMHDDRSPYFYLPGGRVALHERAEDAVLRELREELGIEAKIDRPLWLNQSFFTEDVSGEKYHELCIYFLMDISGADLVARGETFAQQEGRRTHRFQWLPLERLREEYFYPVFLKEAVFHLPEKFTLRTETE
ncbi:MAG: NUDIX domain-containing protein [Eubacteriales bacterium]|nr:NUDIX domain-containing protein [Eubacteriales bacterium]